MVNPLQEIGRLVSHALQNPRVQQVIGNRLKNFTKQKVQQQQQQYQQQAAYQHQTAGAGGSAGGGATGGAAGSNQSEWQRRFNAYNWQRIREQAFQFIIVNFMGVIFVFQIASSVYSSYSKEKRMLQKRKEQEALTQQQRTLVTEQMQERQRLTQALSKKPGDGSKGGFGSSSSSSGGQPNYKTEAMKRREEELHAKMHDMSIDAVQRPISGVGVADCSGLDTNSHYSADIPVQVWITDTSSPPAFDPLMRWQLDPEPSDRSQDALGQRGFLRTG